MLEGLAVGRQRLGLVTQLAVGVAQVLEDHRVVRDLFDGALELGDGALVVTPSVKEPPQRVDDVPVVGLELEGPDDQLLGLVEVDPAAGTATITLKDEDGLELCEKVIAAR